MMVDPDILLLTFKIKFRVKELCPFERRGTRRRRLGTELSVPSDHLLQRSLYLW